jgi:zinc protease
MRSKGVRAALLWAVISIPVGSVGGAEVLVDRLDNGMRLIMDVDRTTGLVATMVAVRSGAAMEDETTHGLTHLLEHMLFDGTKRSTRKELSSRIENAGGYINAYTRKDHILFMTVLPSDSLALGIETLAEMLFESTLPGGELTKERKVVLEELAGEEQREFLRVGRELEACLLAGTPYARSVSGRPEVIERARRATLLSFYRRMFVVNNMTFIAVGDFDATAMREQVERAFGDRRTGPLPPQPGRVVLEQGLRAVRTLPDLRGEYVGMAIPIPPEEDPLSVGVTLALEAFASGERSILRRELDAAGVPVQFVSGNEVRHPGLDAYWVQIATMPGQGEAAQQAAFRAWESFLGTPVEEDELARLHSGLLAAELIDNEKLDHRGWAYAEQDIRGGAAAHARWLARLEAAGTADVERAVEEWLSRQAPSLCLVRARKEGDGAEQGGAAPAVRRVLDNGLTLLAQPNSSRPMVAACVLVRDRLLWEPDERPGLTQFVLQMLPHGAGGRDRIELEKRLAELGARIAVADIPFIPFDDYLMSPMYGFIHVQAPSLRWRELLELVGDLLAAPALPEEAVADVRAQLQQRAGMKAREPAARLRQALFERWFGGGALAHPLFGESESLGAVTHAEVLEHARKVLAPGKLIVALHGDLDVEEALGILERRLGELPGAGEGSGRPSYPPWPADRAAPAEPEQVELPPGQSAVAWYRPVVLDERGFDAARVLAAWITSRMVEQIREREGLAYSLGAGVGRYPGGALFAAVVPTRQGNEARVAELLGEIVGRAAEDLPGDAELENIKRELVGRALRYRQRRIIRAHFAAVDEYWWPGETRPPLAERLKEITREDLAAVAELLGPAERWWRLQGRAGGEE